MTTDGAGASSAPGGANWDLKEMIRSYWSDRAASFDSSPGHRIDPMFAAPPWRALVREALGDVSGRSVLDLACGTGEISGILLELGARVTAIDFAEPMLEQARRKHAGRSWIGWLDDAETLAGEPDGRHDAAVCRHLVWTLVDPALAYRNWRRVLRPAGRLLVVDGDWVRLDFLGRTLRLLARLMPGGKPGRHEDDADLHAAILAQVAYRGGLDMASLRRDMAAAGFEAFRSHDLGPVYGAGLRASSLADRLRLRAPRRFALSCTAPS